MIFTSLLKKKWQNKNSNVRVEAINSSLSVDIPEQKQIIESLANTDENENVRRAALIKLASFDSWLTHSQHNNMAKVRQYALKKVNAILTEQDTIKVNEQAKLDYIAANSCYNFYESWLTSTDEPKVIIALFEKLANKQQNNDRKDNTAMLMLKPQLLINLFSQKQQPVVQKYIVENTADIETLDKLKKKSQRGEITELITEKIAALQEAIDLPIALRKKTNLVLAKLQALKDQYEYSVYLEKREELTNEWQILTSQFNCFSQNEVNVFTEKHGAILSQLDKLFVAKAEQHAQAEIARELENKKQQARIHFDKTLAIIDQTLTTSIFENDTIDEQQYQTLFDKLTHEIIASALSKEEQNSFIAKICQQQQKLQQLPEIAQSVSEATHLISKVSQLALPTTVEEMNQRLPVYQSWLNNWKSTEKAAFGTLPDSIKSAASEIQLNWRQALKPLQQIQKRDFAITQKKLQDVRRLISAGKFNAAFGVFKKAKQGFNALSEQQQVRLQKDFDTLSEKIAELSDWEHYIATPRKQQLLSDIKAIVATPLDNPHEQAEKVKHYRKVWNSLGHADDDAEQSLNSAFNELCETAFAPCRLYFAEQEKLREGHLVTRQGLILQAKALADKFINSSTDGTVISANQFKTLDAELNQLTKQWQSAGQVDRAVYQEINHQFNITIDPVKAVIKTYHYENKQLKQGLIAQAEKLLSTDDINSAVNQVKSLQVKWRETGYAGNKIENKLWQSFRKVNDEIFAKRDAQSAKDKSASSAQVTVLENEFIALESKFSQCLALQDWLDYEQALLALQQKVGQQKFKISVLEKQINSKLKSVFKKLVECKAANEKEQWRRLFQILEQGVGNDTCFSQQHEFEFLSSAWQKKLKVLASKTNSVNRDDATLELEVLSGIDSPAELQQRRMAVQVNLMQTQMSSGASIDLPATFLQWLMLGKFGQRDVDLLQRVKPIFL